MARVAVVGSGFIGRAWAITFARAGHDVALWDENPEAPHRAIDFIASVTPDLAANDLLGGASPEALLARLRAEKTLAAALADADHVQENAPERLDVKKAILLEETTNGPRVRRIIVEGYAPDLNDVELEEIGRDPFLVAAALGGPDRVVVAREVSGPSKKRANRKLPDVCAQFNVPVINDFALYRALNFSIV